MDKLNPVELSLPVQGGQVDEAELMPQLVSWRLKERFRWPSDRLLLSCGVIHPRATDYLSRS